MHIYPEPKIRTEPNLFLWFCLDHTNYPNISYIFKTQEPEPNFIFYIIFDIYVTKE